MFLVSKHAFLYKYAFIPQKNTYSKSFETKFNKDLIYITFYNFIYTMHSNLIIIFFTSYESLSA